MLTPVLSVTQACNETANLLKRRLSECGWKTLRTFDLKEAMFSTEGCSCPHHGTQKCDCEMVVLLIYGLEPEPVTVLLHGCDGQTQVMFGQDAQKKITEASVLAIRRALEGNESTAL